MKNKNKQKQKNDQDMIGGHKLNKYNVHVDDDDKHQGKTNDDDDDDDGYLDWLKWLAYHLDCIIGWFVNKIVS